MQRFSFVFFIVTTPSSLFRWETVQSVAMNTDEFCLFRCNNIEFSNQMGNGSVCWDVERFSFVFFHVTTSKTVFRWETVQSVGMENGSVLSFVRRLPNKLGHQNLTFVILSNDNQTSSDSSLFKCNNAEFSV